MAEQSHAGDGGGGGAGSGEPTNWRKEADDRLRRLHSLQFGADVALKGKDPAGAQVLALRLLGFLDSQALPGDGGAAGHEASFVAPIRAAASSSVAAAIRARAGRSDRYKTLPPPPPQTQPRHPARSPAFSPKSCVETARRVYEGLLDSIRAKSGSDLDGFAFAIIQIVQIYRAIS